MFHLGKQLIPRLSEGIGHGFIKKEAIYCSLAEEDMVLYIIDSKNIIRAFLSASIRWLPIEVLSYSLFYVHLFCTDKGTRRLGKSMMNQLQSMVWMISKFGSDITSGFSPTISLCARSSVDVFEIYKKMGFHYAGNKEYDTFRNQPFFMKWTLPDHTELPPMQLLSDSVFFIDENSIV
jgi:hypothetical protein